MQGALPPLAAQWPSLPQQAHSLPRPGCPQARRPPSTRESRCSPFRPGTGMGRRRSQRNTRPTFKPARSTMAAQQTDNTCTLHPWQTARTRTHSQLHSYHRAGRSTLSQPLRYAPAFIAAVNVSGSLSPRGFSLDSRCLHSNTKEVARHTTKARMKAAPVPCAAPKRFGIACFQDTASTLGSNSVNLLIRGGWYQPARLNTRRSPGLLLPLEHVPPLAVLKSPSPSAAAAAEVLRGGA